MWISFGFTCSEYIYFRTPLHVDLITKTPWPLPGAISLLFLLPLHTTHTPWGLSVLLLPSSPLPGNDIFIFLLLYEYFDCRSLSFSIRWKFELSKPRFFSISVIAFLTHSPSDLFPTSFNPKGVCPLIFAEKDPRIVPLLGNCLPSNTSHCWPIVSIKRNQVVVVGISSQFSLLYPSGC